MAWKCKECRSYDIELERITPFESQECGNNDYYLENIASELTYKTQNRIKGIISVINIYNYIKTACGFNRKEIYIFYKDKYMKNNFFHTIVINFILSLDVVKKGKDFSEYIIRENLFDNYYITLEIKNYTIICKIKNRI